MLAIDQMVQKAITQTAGQAATIPQLWRGELEPNLRKRAVLQQSLLENTDLVGTAGDAVYIPSLPDVSAAVALTEGTDMTVGALSNSTNVKFTPSEVGAALGITRKALDRIKYDGMAAIVERLAYAMSLYIEGSIAALWNASVPTVGGSMTVQYPNGHASGTIVSTDVLTSKVILNGIQTLETSDVMPFDDGMWVLYITPKQYYDLLQDSDVRNDLRYNQSQAMFRGEVGVYHNCHIVKSTHLKRPVENTVTTSKALLLGPRWAAVAWKRRPEVVIDPTLYDFGRRRQVAVTADLDIELLHSDRSLVITTA